MRDDYDDGGSAFPLPLGTMNCSEPEQSGGMTLRDYFAAKAMQGILAGDHPNPITREADPLPVIAKSAYAMADCMLKARAS